MPSTEENFYELGNKVALLRSLLGLRQIVGETVNNTSIKLSIRYNIEQLRKLAEKLQIAKCPTSEEIENSGFSALEPFIEEVQVYGMSDFFKLGHDVCILQMFISRPDNAERSLRGTFCEERDRLAMCSGQVKTDTFFKRTVVQTAEV